MHMKNNCSRGFTLIELAITIFLLTVILPATALLFTTVLQSYRSMAIQKSITSDATFTLQRFAKETNDLVEFIDLNNNSFRFRNSRDELKGFAFEDSVKMGSIVFEKFMYCPSECDPPDDNWYTLVENLSHNSGLGRNEIRYYVENLELYNSLDPTEIKYIELKLIFNSPDGEAVFYTIIHPDHLD